MTTPEQSAQRIYNLLTEALSEDAIRRNTAEKALRQAEEDQDFFASLAQIVAAPDEEVTPVVRWLAAVCAKNAIPRSWRRHTRKNAVTDDERQFVISTLLDCLGEKHSNIATQLSVWIASIARHDFPRHWDTCIPDLCQRIRTAQHITLSRHALITLDMTLKQLASRRLMSDRMVLYRNGPETFALLFDLFCSKVDEFIATVTIQPDKASQPFDFLVYCLKSLRRVITYGCAELSVLQQLNQLFVKIESHPELFMCGASGGNDFQIRLSLLVAKLVRASQERHMLQFQPYIPGFLRIYYNTMLSYNPVKSDDRTCAHITSFLENCLNRSEYGAVASNTADNVADDTESTSETPSSNAYRNIVSAFFTEEATNAITKVILEKIFVLTDAELEAWANDPEILVQEEEAAAGWGRERLRQQCEILLVMLLNREPKLASFIVNLAELVPSDKPLLLDACYRAIGKSASNLFQVFDFNSWLNGSLGTVLETPATSDLGARVIHARAIWLIGQFVRYLNSDARIKIYPSLVRLLSSMQHDRVITLTAAKTIHYLVDDLGFKGEDFAPYLPTCIESCFKLIASSSAYETKRDLLVTVENLVVACDSTVIVPVAQQIVSCIPALWNECSVSNSTLAKSPAKDSNESNGIANVGHGAQNEVDWSSGEMLLRSSIVTLLTSTIQRTGDIVLKSKGTTKIVMTVLEFAISSEPGMGGSHMLEEGCDLWLSVVEASEEYNEELRQCFPHALSILSRDYDSLHKIFELMKAYMLIGGEVFMREFADGIVQPLRNTLGNVRDRGLLAAVDVLDVLLRAFPQEGVRLCGEILRYMLERVSGSTESGVVMGAYMGLIGRAALVNVGHMEVEIFHGQEATCVEVLDLMIDHLDTMNRLPRRQVGTLALIGLVGRYMSSEEVLKRVPGVLNCAVQVLSEEKKIQTRKQALIERNDFENMVSRSGESKEDSAFDIFHSTRFKNPESHGEKRTKLLAQKDTEVCMGVADACLGLLVNLKATNEASYSRVVSWTDPRVLNQCEMLLREANIKK